MGKEEEGLVGQGRSMSKTAATRGSAVGRGWNKQLGGLKVRGSERKDVGLVPT